MTTGEQGQVAGLEGLAFGVLVFVFGTVLAANAWAVVDAKLAAAAAAREATRVFVEAAPGAAGDAAARAERAGLATFEGHGRDPRRATVVVRNGRLVRCARVVVEATYEVPFVRIPVVRPAGSRLVVSARHTELVDPYRSGLGRQVARC